MIAVLILITLGLRGSGAFNASDDSRYLNWARVFIENEAPEKESLNQTVVRVTVWLPVSLASATGLSIHESAVLLGILWGAVIVVGMCFLGARSLPVKEGCLAAMLLVSLLPFARFVPVAYPEIPMTACLVMAFVVYRRMTTPQNVWPWVIIGSLIGIACLAKQSAIVAFPVLAIHTAYRFFEINNIKRGLFSVALIGLGGLLVCAALAVFLGLWVGKAGYFFEVLSYIGDLSKQAPQYEKYTSNQWLYLSHLSGAEFFHLGVVVVATSIVATVSSSKFRLEGLFGTTMLLYLMFGTISFSEYVRPTQHTRYLIPCLPFWLLGFVQAVAWGGRWILKLLPANMRKKATQLTIGTVILSMFLFAYDRSRPMWPLSAQLALVDRAQEQSDALYVSLDWLQRYSPVLSKEQKRRFLILENLDAASWLSNQGDLILRSSEFLTLANEIDSAGLREDPMVRDSIVWAPPWKWSRSIFRQWIDKIRGKSKAEYYSNPLLYWVQHKKSSAVSADNFGGWPFTINDNDKPRVKPSWRPTIIED